ncbi:Os01g0369800, partial [Oryza sativa Japonica Group]
HAGHHLLHRRPGQQRLPPRLHVRVRVDHAGVLRRHEVAHVGEVAEVREADAVAGEVPGARQPRLVHPEHLLQLPDALVHDALVAVAALELVDDAVPQDGPHGGLVLVGFHVQPHVHHCRLLQASTFSESQELWFVLAKDVPSDCSRF